MILLGIWRGRWGHGGDKKEGIEEYAYRVGRFHSLFPLELVSKKGFKYNPSVHYYLGVLDDKPVATSLLYLGGGVAGIYYVATLPEARRRGIGSALTVAPLLQAQARGYRIGTLQSTPVGLNLYRRLGFREYCVFYAYFWGGE
jgi:ribosomal protein S18 acetylase RimI-like enzyme